MFRGALIGAGCLALAWPVAWTAPETQAPAWNPKASVEYLLTHQREDGTWAPGKQVNPDSGGGVTTGTAALASMALLDYWDLAPEEIRKAVSKGIGACLARVWRKAEGANDFGMIAWGQVYTLQLLGRAAARPEFKEQAPGWLKEQEEILTWLLRRQGKCGGWGYRSSFHTAGTLLGLLDAKRLGLAVPEKNLDGAVAFLASLRQGHSYRYSLPVSPDQQDGLGEPRRFEDSAGRLGVCALALLERKGLSQEEFDGDLATFIAHRDFLWTTRAGVKEGRWPRFGGASPYPYFAFFGYYYTACALKRASPEKRQAWTKTVREDLLAAMEPDGTWINLDIPPKQTEAGRRIYSTAMALMALKLLPAE